MPDMELDAEALRRSGNSTLCVDPRTAATIAEKSESGRSLVNRQPPVVAAKGWAVSGYDRETMGMA